MLYMIAKILVLPPTSFFVLFLLGLLLGRWRRRLGRAFLWGLFLVVYLSTTPFLAGELMAPLQPYPPVDPLHPDSTVDAIVVLGAGLRSGAPEYRWPIAGSEPDTAAGSLTLQRLQYAAFLAKLTGKPVLVSGGPSGHWPQYTVADTMKLTLERDFGVEVRWAEALSRSTSTNAAQSAAQLRGDGIRRIYLVTHAWHMPRAMAEFQANGLEPIPAPTRFVSRSTVTWRDFVPSAHALTTTYYAVHEWLGLAWRSLRG